MLTWLREQLSSQRKSQKRRRISGSLSDESFAVSVDAMESRLLLTPTALQAIHRSGQTFLTWTEDLTVTGEKYHVYRSTSPITTANLGSAEKLTGKWGPLDEDTSIHKLAGPSSPGQFVISDLGTPLAVTQGLFVWTTQAGEGGRYYYYAVTEVNAGVEDTTVQLNVNSLGAPVLENVNTPAPVLVTSSNGGKGRVYTQFMDYRNWNPTFQGYAYNYAVSLPADYNPAQAYPLKLVLHAYSERYSAPTQSEFGWQAIEVFADDPGFDQGTTHTWWYGFAADWNYQTEGNIPTRGVIENFTEQRILKAIDEVIANPAFNVDTQRIHAQGHSMGASGSLSLGIRYGNVFSGVFASEAMTNYGASPQFQNEFEILWGSKASNLTIRNRGTHATPIAKYGSGGASPTGVYNWMNHQEQIVRLRALDMAFLMFGHGKADTVIDWQTQGKPMIAAVNQAKVAFTAEDRGAYGHNWMGFSFANHPMFSNGYEDLGDWAFKGNISYPAIQGATQSGPNVPANTGTDFYNLEIDWAVPWNNFGAAIVDTTDAWAMTMRSRNGVQTADVTPRNLQQFLVTPGATISWTNTNVSTGLAIQSGTVVASADGLATIPQVQILTGSGNRLALTVTRQETAFAESGQVTTVYNVWTKVNLTRTYVNPVVITGGPSYKGADPGVIRIRRVQAGSFEIMYQEWEYLDGNHTYETVPYVVIEAGTHTLGNGAKFVAGKATVNHNIRRVNAAIPANAAVLTTVQSTNGGAAIVPRIRNVTTTGFDALVSEQEAADQYHYDETLGWLAVTAGNGDAGATSYHAGVTPDMVGSDDYLYAFGAIGTTGSPIVLASVMTYDGADPITVRQKWVTSTRVQLFLQEEQSRDAEVYHTWEQLGILALEPGVLTKPTAAGGATAPSFAAPYSSSPPAPSLFALTDSLFALKDEDLLF
ncbi:MAG: hypothetical protein KDA96_02480 [Planctomycetaceae bacterium]|nr:hypothetical protein [Planctomycetaceae bacterium]